MNIPKSYEALTADLASEKILSKTLQGQKEAYMMLADSRKVELDAALWREAALREELDRTKKAYEAYGIDFDRSEEKAESLQQRLTVAEQLLSEALCHAQRMEPISASLFNRIDSVIGVSLKPVEEGEAE